MKSQSRKCGIWVAALIAMFLTSTAGNTQIPPFPPGGVPNPNIPDEVVPISFISQLIVTSIAGKTPAQTNSTAPTVQFSVVELELDGYDEDGPPRIVVRDHATGEVFFETEFKSSNTPGNQPPQKISLPIQLAYDKDPWSNTDKEPDECMSRIEITNVHGTQTYYVKLTDGIFVVPVVWHNVLELGEPNYVEQITLDVTVDPVFDLFMTPPTVTDYSTILYTGSTASDMNTIWGQAGIQFHLLDVSLPFGAGEIDNIVYPPAETSSVEQPCAMTPTDLTGTPGWAAGKFNLLEAVDIYAVYSLKNIWGQSIGGLGNCFLSGSVYIAAGIPGGSNDAFTSGFNIADARAILVAHEFGHFIGSLPHINTYTNLMNQYLGNWKLTPAQIALVRQRLKDQGSYLEGI